MVYGPQSPWHDPIEEARKFETSVPWFQSSGKAIQMSRRNRVHLPSATRLTQVFGQTSPIIPRRGWDRGSKGNNSAAKSDDSELRREKARIDTGYSHSRSRLVLRLRSYHSRLIMTASGLGARGGAIKSLEIYHLTDSH